MSLNQVLPMRSKSSPQRLAKMAEKPPSDILTPPPSREGSFNGDAGLLWGNSSSELRTPRRVSSYSEPEDSTVSSSWRDDASIPPLAYPPSPASSIKLPSYNELVQGLHAMAQSHEAAPSWSPVATPCRVNSGLQNQQPLPSAGSFQHLDEILFHGFDGSPDTASDHDRRHINKKYTTEEGDFIIYAWHDKKLKWQTIKQQYAMIFGKEPRRTVQGLQAWYYRMNQRIPVWDSDGWLIFDGEDELEPRQISIKCRERDLGRRRAQEPMGLAQRYPERLMGYHWVDAESKQQARDWAEKRKLQYRQRRERRKRKESRGPCL